MNQAEITIGERYFVKFADDPLKDGYYSTPFEVRNRTLEVTVLRKRIEGANLGRKDHVEVDITEYLNHPPTDGSRRTMFVHARRVIETQADRERKIREAEEKERQQELERLHRTYQIAALVDSSTLGELIQESERVVPGVVGALKREAHDLKTRVDKLNELIQNIPAGGVNDEGMAEQLPDLDSEFYWVTSEYGDVVTALSMYNSMRILHNQLAEAGIDYKRVRKIRDE